MKTENKDGKTLRYTNTGETAITAGSIVYVCGRMGIAKSAIPAGATGIIDMTGGVFKFSPTVSGNKAQGVAVYLPRERRPMMAPAFSSRPEPIPSWPGISTKPRTMARKK